MTMVQVEPAFDAGTFRRALGHVPTSVCVVTAVDDDGPFGMTVGSFSSISLDPPLVGFFADSGSATLARMRGTARLCINVLGDRQGDVCGAFASRRPDRFAGVAHHRSTSGAVRIDGALAWIECGIDRVIAVGDHDLVVDRVIDLLGAGAARWAVDLGHRMATEIIEEIPAFGGSDEAFETLRMGTESSCQHALITLATGDPGAALSTEESLEGDRDFVRRGIRLDLVLRGIRIGHARMATELLGAAATLVPAGERTAEMERTSTLLFAYIDLFSSSMAEEYLAEHDRWVTSAAAERAELVRDLLDGRPVATADVSQRLGYQLERHHVAMVLWQPGTEHSPTDLQRAAARLVEAHGCGASLEIPHGTSSLWL